MTVARNLTLVILVAVLVQCAYAAPTTVAATGLTSQNITFRASGVTPPVYWEYGTRTDNLLWKTENVTGSGLANTTETGTPLMSDTLFYFRACDQTGCGGTLSATLLAVTPAPSTTYGQTAHNISISHFEGFAVAGAVPEPYAWAAGTPMIVMGLTLFFIFSGIWLRHRETILPVMLGLIGSGLLLYGGVNSVGIPPAFVMVAISFVTLAFVGIVVGLFKR